MTSPHHLNTAARLTISLCAAAALTVIWVAGFPSSSSANLRPTPPPSHGGPQPSPLSSVPSTVQVSSAATLDDPIPDEAQVQQEVPDLRNLPVWVARKRAKSAGFDFVFLEGQRELRRSDYGFMRTNVQSPQPGAMAVPGAPIEFQTVERYQFASGY